MLFERGSVPAGPPVETKKALILLDLQNDFVNPEGNLHVSNVESFVPSLLCLVSEFREKGEVIWIRTEYSQSRTTVSPITGSHSILLKQFLQPQDPNDDSSEYYNNPDNARSPHEDPLSPSSKPDVIHDREAFLGPVISPTRHRSCMPGSWGAEYPDSIQDAIDKQRDKTMEKSHYSAFTDTPLLMHLRMRLITEIYICGSLSNVGVYASVLDAVCNGIRVTVIEDCLGYLDETCHVEAMRQMADNMGASGIDCQELRDDTAGLLGDVFREEDYTTKFQLSLPPPRRATRSNRSRQQITDWISALEAEENPDASTDAQVPMPKQPEIEDSGRRDVPASSESFRRTVKRKPVVRSPPQKRSTSDLDTLDEDRAPKTSQNPSRRTSTHIEQLKPKQTQQPARKRPPSRESSIRSLTPTKSPINRTRLLEASSSEIMSSEIDLNRTQNTMPDGELGPRLAAPKKKKKITPNILGLEDKIGEGDTKLYLGLLDQTEAVQAFYACREDVRWQTMLHRSGEVPRLVAIQGTMSPDGYEVPLYRHPADESPELLPFDRVVNMLRKAAERVVRHPLNHVLIQWYRNSEDNISEHSDKTLDIVRGSNIVNVSLGAQRTMILRTKKSAITPIPDDPEPDASRPSQRVPLPHNSLFILGQKTNQHWLHSIRADKRPANDKTAAELAFAGERISFTFRHIGTFIDLVANTIWGQGATSKRRDEAAPVTTGADAEKESEALIRAFGQENHRSVDWDWDKWYGGGFNVVNFQTKKTEEKAEIASETGESKVGPKPQTEKREFDQAEGNTAEAVPTPL